MGKSPERRPVSTKRPNITLYEVFNCRPGTSPFRVSPSFCFPHQTGVLPRHPVPNPQPLRQRRPRLPVARRPVLPYQDLGSAARRQAWLDFFEHFGRGRFEIGEAELDRLAELPVNGREIKDPIKSAYLFSPRSRQGHGQAAVYACGQAGEGVEDVGGAEWRCFALSSG
ncbi:hypothetical protein VTK56DRAFT_5764 [Thermocarpiscus australiensis]